MGKTTKVGFPKSERQPLYLTGNLNYPGPGEYYRQQKRIFKFAHTISKRHDFVLNDTPGPGQYAQNHFIAIEPNVKMNALKKQFNII